MSGLGDRKNLSLKSIEERYKSICELAANFSILSLGISCFQIADYGLNERNVKVSNRTFNILTMCSEEFLVEPKALKFLINHGFDFNELFKTGLNYYKENDKLDDASLNKSKYSVRDLFVEISHSKKPVCLHNGFIDLIFLYQNFYAKCPNNSLKFLADLEEMFPGGLYDTKYIADFHAHSSASFLQYLYKKALYENTKFKSFEANKYIDMEFAFDNSFLADFSIKPVRESTGMHLCHTYSVYGYCQNIETCTKSHDINLIIQNELLEEKRKKRKRQKNRKSIDIEEEITEINVEFKAEDENRKADNQPHSAGLDAFMTGYVMLNYINKFTKFEKSKADEIYSEKVLLKDIHKLESLFRNNISLAGKDYPLVVAKSNFISISNAHREKKERLNNNGKNKN